MTPSDDLITDFSDVSPEGVFVDGDSYSTRPADWWLQFYGSTYVYPSERGALQTTVDDAWHIFGTVSDWSGFGLWLGACTVDLSEYRGVSFDIAGDAGPSGTVELFVNTGPNSEPEDCRTNVGHCDATSGECQSPSAVFPVPQGDLQTVTVLFEDATGGKPRPTPDPADIIQFHFAFDWTDWNGMRSEPYQVDLSVDNVRLVR